MYNDRQTLEPDRMGHLTFLIVSTHLIFIAAPGHDLRPFHLLSLSTLPSPHHWHITPSPRSPRAVLLAPSLRPPRPLPILHPSAGALCTVCGHAPERRASLDQTCRRVPSRPSVSPRLSRLLPADRTADVCQCAPMCVNVRQCARMCADVRTRARVREGELEICAAGEAGRCAALSLLLLLRSHAGAHSPLVRTNNWSLIVSKRGSEHRVHRSPHMFTSAVRIQWFSTSHLTLHRQTHTTISPRCNAIEEGLAGPPAAPSPPSARAGAAFVTAHYRPPPPRPPPPARARGVFDLTGTRHWGGV